MPAFLTPLVTAHVKAGRKRLASPLSYLASNGVTYTVPAGTESDGASVPRLLWWLYPAFGGQYEPATWLHDDLYARAERYAGTDDWHVSRAEADGLFYEAMREGCGWRASGCEVVFHGVRVGGWWPWRKYRRAASRG